MGLDREQLNQFSVASPCAEPWDRMRGDDQVRHCDRCEKNVYNISVMKLEDIAQLVERKEGRMCVRFFRRADGTILTEDCPVGMRQKVRRKLALAAAFIGTAWAVAAYNLAWVSAKITGKPLPPKTTCGTDDSPGRWVAGGMRPMPPVKPVPVPLPSIARAIPPPQPMLPPVNFKVKGIAGNENNYVATLEFEGQTIVVQKDAVVPDAQYPQFIVKSIRADSVEVFDVKINRIVKKLLLTQ